MREYTIHDVVNCSERYKLFVLFCKEQEIPEITASLKRMGVNSLDIGRSLAGFIESTPNHRFLAIEALEFIQNLFDSLKCKSSMDGNEVLAIFNLGILFEPFLELNAMQLLRDVSKTVSLIIIWDNNSDTQDILTWDSQKENCNLNFSQTPLKKMHYAI